MAMMQDFLKNVWGDGCESKGFESESDSENDSYNIMYDRFQINNWKGYNKGKLFEYLKKSEQIDIDLSKKHIQNKLDELQFIKDFHDLLCEISFKKNVVKLLLEYQNNFEYNVKLKIQEVLHLNKYQSINDIISVDNKDDVFTGNNDDINDGVSDVSSIDLCDNSIHINNYADNVPDIVDDDINDINDENKNNKNHSEGDLIKSHIYYNYKQGLYIYYLYCFYDNI